MHQAQRLSLLRTTTKRPSTSIRYASTATPDRSPWPSRQGTLGIVATMGVASSLYFYFNSPYVKVLYADVEYMKWVLIRDCLAVAVGIKPGSSFIDIPEHNVPQPVVFTPTGKILDLSIKITRVDRFDLSAESPCTVGFVLEMPTMEHYHNIGYAREVFTRLAREYDDKSKLAVPGTSAGMSIWRDEIITWVYIREGDKVELVELLTSQHDPDLSRLLP